MTGTVERDPARTSPGKGSHGAALRADFDRYLGASRVDYRGLRAWLDAATEYGFLALCVYRYGQWQRDLRPLWLRIPFRLLYSPLEFLVHVLFGIRLSPNAVIGPGLHIAHFGGIVVRGRIGANCSIAQGVTIGAKGAGLSAGFPVIGDRVYIGAGAMVIGDVAVGNDVVVGANTVVVRDVPEGSRVVSAAVRILPPRMKRSGAGCVEPRPWPRRRATRSRRRGSSS
jgi:serine O-acetyltransferase